MTGDLWRYVNATEGLFDELLDELSEEEIELLRKNIETWPEEEFWKALTSYKAECSSYISSTPSQRDKKKAWQSPEVRPLIIYFSIIYIQWAHNLLEMVNTHMLEPGSKYRDMAVEAINAYLDLFDKSINWWPFDDESPIAWA